MPPQGRKQVAALHSLTQFTDLIVCHSILCFFYFYRFSSFGFLFFIVLLFPPSPQATVKLLNYKHHSKVASTAITAKWHYAALLIWILCVPNYGKLLIIPPCKGGAVWEKKQKNILCTRLTLHSGVMSIKGQSGLDGCHASLSLVCYFQRQPVDTLNYTHCMLRTL